MRIILAVVLFISLLTGAAGLVGLNAYRAPGPLMEPQDVVVPHGGLDVVGDSLMSAGVINRRLIFKAAVLVTFSGGPLHAGELHFPASASLQAVLHVLRNSRPVQHRVTIAEGLEAARIAQVLARQGALLVGELIVPEEGALLPETYVFERGTAMSALASRARSAMRSALAAEWTTRAAGLPLQTEQQALILASIVEHEARLAEERPMIARVFLNRLIAGMRLQADPTVAYGVEGGLGVPTHALNRDDLSRVDGYNTYMTAGLPAAAICSPGLASLRAVLHPAAGSALYFVADGTGGHVFAATLPQHEANVARYRSKASLVKGAAAR